MKKLIAIIFLIFLLSGCSIDSQRIEWANHVCESHGGVNRIMKGPLTTAVHCGNGAWFQGTEFTGK